MYFIMHANQTFLVMNKEKLGDLAATEAKQKVRPEDCNGSLYYVLRTLYRSYLLKLKIYQIYGLFLAHKISN